MEYLWRIDGLMMEKHKSFGYARYFRIWGYPLFIFTIYLICLEVSGKNIIACKRRDYEL